ncbi:spermine/spermidine synthase [Histoplasma capsulatum H143]|uniref:Spermine/spermidine synthase n=1 Tax=Ajellomyces capsulatus (strain H143) TaxID=544712 RepID=C6HFP9_AJECH|nr:spermine/spermidine synthase [Histoplasma capsulatum H143]
MPSKKSLSRGGRSSQRAESEQKPTPQPQKVNENQLVSTPKTIKLIGLAALLLALTATYSPISQLTLSPVYGSVPSVAVHQRGMMVAALCGWFGKDQIRKRLSIKVMNFLPVLALSIPTIQFFLFQWSEQLGAIYGPFLTELLTYFPLVFLSVASVTMLLEDAGLKRYSETLGNHGPFFGSYILFSTLQKFFGFLLPRYIGHNALMARAPLQLIAASLYAISLPSKWLLLALPSVLFSARYNVHFPFAHNTALLNSTLQAENFVLLHREESLTGYLSVLENVKEHYRVMSGLGIGTTPTALVNHGIDTTVVEIDPAVYHIAADYFSIPKNFTPVIQDAVRFVDEATRATPAPRFDFIVHDVFTGGVEPINLFTVEFMKGLSALLKEDGVIAINYAGDLSLPSSGLIVRTIKSVFPSCRIFRESEPPADTREGDFTNMVIFCKQTDSPLEFRNPTEADFLGSKSRESYLLPQYEINAASFAKPEEDQQDILAVGHAGNLVRWHSQSAAGHWKIMRTVLPAFVWENW